LYIKISLILFKNEQDKVRPIIIITITKLALGLQQNISSLKEGVPSPKITCLLVESSQAEIHSQINNRWRRKEMSLIKIESFTRKARCRNYKASQNRSNIKVN